MGSCFVAQNIANLHKNKNNQPKTNVKNNRKLKEMINITPTMDHYPKNGQIRDTHPLSDISY